MSAIRDRYRGALLGAALGDALGAPFEGCGPSSQFPAHRLASRQGELKYTDDTHMTIGLAQSLLDCDGFDGRHMLSVFAKNFDEEPWRGYGPGPPEVFRLSRQGVPWDAAAFHLFGGAGSLGNGAAMRVTPVALFTQRDAAQAADLARRTAALTHAHPVGVDGAVAQALALVTVLSLHEFERVTPERLATPLLEWVTTNQFRDQLLVLQDLGPSPSFYDVAYRLGNGVEADRSVPSALAAFLRTPDDFPEVVRFCVSLGGDTDTIACMAGALAGARGGESSLPPEWLDRLENAGELRRLADEIASTRC